MTQPYYGGAVDILTSDIIHAVDSLRWMGGEVKKIASLVKNFHAEIANAFNALLEFESGAVGILLSNHVVGKRIFAVEMHGYNISAYVEPEDRAVIYRDNHNEGETLLTTDVAQSEDFHHYAGFFAESHHFIDCLQQGEMPQTNLADAIKTMELVDRVYHSQL